jgi:hypothetical protein
MGNRGFVCRPSQSRPVVTTTSSKRHRNVASNPASSPDGAPQPAHSKGRGGWRFEVSGGRPPGANRTQNNDTSERGSNASQRKKDRRATVRGGAPGGVTPHPDVSSITMSLLTRRKGVATARYRRRNNLPGRKRQMTTAEREAVAATALEYTGVPDCTAPTRRFGHIWLADSSAAFRAEGEG